MNDQKTAVKAVKVKKKSLLIFVSVLFVFLGVGLFMTARLLQEPNLSKSSATKDIVSIAIAEATVERMAKNNYELVYEISLPIDIILSMSPEDAVMFIKDFGRKHAEIDKFKRNFISIKPQQIETKFVELSYKAWVKKSSISSSLWDSHRGGLKKFLSNKKLFYEKIRWYRLQTNMLAIEFLAAFEGGNTYKYEYDEKVFNVEKEWDAFLENNFGEECSAVFPVVYGEAQAKATWLLAEMSDLNSIVRRKLVKKELEVLNQYQLYHCPL